MQQLKLEHSVKGNITSNPNLDSLEINLKRHEEFMGVFFMFSGEIKLMGAFKTWVDDVFSTHGLDSIIDVTFYKSTANEPYWSSKHTGIADGDNYNKEQDYSVITFEDSKFERKLITRGDFEIEYNYGETLDGLTCAGYTDWFQDVLFRGRASGSPIEATGKAAFPFEVFDNVISKITDTTYRTFRSTALGRSDATFNNDFGFNYPDDGKFSHVMITNGAYISGFPHNPTTGKETGKVSLYLKFNELVREFMNIANLAIGIDKDDNGRKIVVMESLSEFFLREVLIDITATNNMKIEYDKRYFIKKIDNSYQKTNIDNDFGITEYNGKSEFATGINIGEDMDLTNNYRTDYSGLMTALSNLEGSRSADGGDDVSTDNHIFLAHSFNDSGTIKTVNADDENDDFVSVGGIYPDSDLQFNIFLSPARKMRRHGEIIRIGLDDNDKDLIKYLKTEGANNLNSQAYDESNVVYETQDMNKSTLDERYLTGRKFIFDCILTDSQIATIIDERIGLIQFTNTIENVTSYGFIDECKVDIVSNKVNFTLLEADNVQLLSRNKLLEDDSQKITESGEIKATE